MSISKPVREAIKEFLRIELIAAIPVLIVALQTEGMTLELITLQTVIAMLRGFEKYLYKSGKPSLF